MSGPGGASTSATPLSSRRLYRVPAQATPTPRKYATLTTPGSAAGRPQVPTQELPMSVVFDDIMRHFDYYNSCGSENEFLEFIDAQEDCRKKWYSAEQEVLRMRVEMANIQAELQRNEMKMADFRRQFESKLEVVARLEAEKDTLKNRNNSASLLMKTYLNDTRIPYDAKDKIANILAALEGVELKRNLKAVLSPGLDTISEADTTDLSMTQSEDDLDCSLRRSRGGRSKRRSNELNVNQEVSRKRIRTSKGSRQMVESFGTMDQVVSKTIVSIPRSGGPIHATSTLETVPPSGYDNRTHVSHSIQPSAPPMTGTSESETDQPGMTYVMKPHYQTRSSVSKKDNEVSQSPRFGRTLSSTSGNMKNHGWVEKTVLARETCGQCNKSIRFAKIALKCKNCRATCHPECKDNVPLPCVTATSTPSNRKGQLGVIADYTPNTHPMVPALIQHCVNEIEIRGLTLEGLYRVPGLERDVKELKERFLRGKGVPNLSVYDPHSICGTIKDFLRSLREPLVGRWFWRDFALATDISDPIKRQTEIHRALDELPPPNQDTLAFLILHLQRVAEIDVVKMPLSNMAKVFGPTIIGYSSRGLDAAVMLQETKKQQLILGTLLSMSADYWRRFINRTQPIPLVDPNNPPRRSSRTTRFSSIGRARANTIVASTPTVIQAANNKGTSKRIYFQDDSPQDTQKTTRPKRNYFD